jgi:8-hydroxy-5-deazaflavin:NADPH oxidoreductase
VKVAVIGGTGRMGAGIAKQLSKNYEVIIGSRDPAKAALVAKRIGGARGVSYEEAAREADVVVLAIPYSSLGTVATLAKYLAGKLVISVVNPLSLRDGLLHFALERGSAAQELAAMLPKTRVATAFNNVPARLLAGEDVPAMDILVAADSNETFEEAAKLIRSLPRVRPLYVGPLSEAEAVERITAVVLNLAKLNGTRSLTVRFVEG